MTADLWSRWSCMENPSREVRSTMQVHEPLLLERRGSSTPGTKWENQDSSPVKASCGALNLHHSYQGSIISDIMPWSVGPSRWRCLGYTGRDHQANQRPQGTSLQRLCTGGSEGWAHLAHSKMNAPFPGIREGKTTVQKLNIAPIKTKSLISQYNLKKSATHSQIIKG